MYKWDRALEIAVNNKTHVDTVIAYRQRFLQMYKKQETNDKFKQLGQELQVNWEEIKMKIKQDKEREAAAAQWKAWYRELVRKSWNILCIFFVKLLNKYS